VTYVYGTAMTWDEWRSEWEDSGSPLPFHEWFCRTAFPPVVVLPNRETR